MRIISVSQKGESVIVTLPALEVGVYGILVIYFSYDKSLHNEEGRLTVKIGEEDKIDMDIINPTWGIIEEDFTAETGQEVKIKLHGVHGAIGKLSISYVTV